MKRLAAAEESHDEQCEKKKKKRVNESWEDWRWRRFKLVARALWHYSPLPSELATEIMRDTIVTYFTRTIYVVPFGYFDETLGVTSFRSCLVGGLTELVLSVKRAVKPAKAYGSRDYFVLGESDKKRYKLQHRSDFVQCLEHTVPECPLVVTYYESRHHI